MSDIKTEIVYLYANKFEYAEKSSALAKEMDQNPKTSSVYRAVKVSTPFSGSNYNIVIKEILEDINNDFSHKGIFVEGLKGSNHFWKYDFIEVSLNEILEEMDIEATEIQKALSWDKDNADIQDLLNHTHHTYVDDDNIDDFKTLMEYIKDNKKSLKESPPEYEEEPKKNKVKRKGYKKDTQKLRTDLIPTEALEEIAKVLTFGSEKYDDDNWRNGMEWRRMYGAALRHMFAWNRGEDLDPETNTNHLANAACNLLFLIYHQHYGLGTDDRWVFEEGDE
jgi:hypothetical protein